MLLISIPKPCHENWDKMSPRNQGSFCNVCSKTVIDFTTLSDDEVKNHFLQNSGQQICGRFRNKQLTDPENSLAKILVGSIPFWKKFLAILIILFGSFLTGCEQPVQGKVSVPSQLETTVGITLTEIDVDEKIQVRESQIEECTTTVGFSELVIIPDAICPDSPAILEIVPDSISTVIKPDLQRIDSVRKKIPEKNECDSIKTKNILFLNP